MAKNNKSKKRNITISDLAGMTKRSFDHVDEQFKRVDEQFHNVRADIAELKTDVRETKETTNKIYNLLDKNLKTQETMKQEFTILKHQGNKIKEVIKDKLGVEIQ